MSRACTISTKSGPGRDAVALLHRVVRRHALLEGVQRGGVLPVQRDLDHRRQQPWPSRGAVGQDRDLALDQPGLAQALHAPQAGGRRDVHALGERLVALGGVALQRVEQAQVDGIEV